MKIMCIYGVDNKRGYYLIDPILKELRISDTRDLGIIFSVDRSAANKYDSSLCDGCNLYN